MPARDSPLACCVRDRAARDIAVALRFRTGSRERPEGKAAAIDFEKRRPAEKVPTRLICNAGEIIHPLSTSEP